MKIPPNNKWLKSSETDFFGSLWSSWNLDLQSNKGGTRVSPRTIVTTNDITDLGVPVSFATFTDQNAGIQYAWALAGAYVFRINLSTAGYVTAFAKDASTGTPTTCSSDTSDMAFFGKTFMVATISNDVYRYDAASGQWNDGANELTSGGVHMLAVYADKFYVTDSGTKIYSFTPANYGALTLTGSYTLNIANKGYNVTSISTIRPVSDGIWVFTINQSEDGCWAFKWDGVTANDPNYAYIIPDASGVLACVIKDDTPWIIDNNARLMYFNGGTFVEAPNGRLPAKNTKFLKNALSSVNDRWIHPNGIDIVDGRIRVLVNNEYEDNGATVEENLASGVWEYTQESGWIHIMSLSLYTSSITDHGQNRVSRVGALYAAKHQSTAATANGTMLLGAQLFSDASATKEVILTDDSNDTVQKYGYFVSTKIFSNEIEDTWQKLYLRHRPLLDAADKIIAKYRVVEETPTEVTASWTSTTALTTTGDISDYVVGDEVEVLQGTGGGKCAHITQIVFDGVNYDVDLDETFTGATGTAKVRFQKWKKLGVQTNQNLSFLETSINKQSTWVQLKVCLQFKGEDEVDDLILTNKTHREAI